MKIYISTILVLLLIITPIVSKAQINLNIDYPEFGGITPSAGMEFSDLIIWLYYLIITIATAAAFGMIVYGGMEYLTSAGNESRMTSGKEKIKAAIIGLLIIIISYLVLETINPQLLEMPSLEV